MNNEFETFEETNNCWKQEGIWGNGSCVELKQVINCRNCKIYSAAGRNLLERKPPVGYVEEWTKILAEEKIIRNQKNISVVIFRCGTECLALSTKVFKEITQMRIMHSLPHKSNTTLLGMVNIRGEIQLCVSFHGLLDLKKDNAILKNKNFNTFKRMVVIEKEGKKWVFPVDEIYGIYHFNQEAIGNVPVTVSKTAANFTKGIVNWQEKRVGFLDEELLFATLKKVAL